MKIFAALLSMFLASNIVFASVANASYRLNYKVNGLIDPKTTAASINASSYDSAGVDGWHWFADYDGDVVADDVWRLLRDQMKEGIKIVLDNGHVSFINKYNLLNASCLPISQIDSLQIGSGRIAWDEDDCNSSGMDFGQIFIRGYEPIYNYNGWVTFSSFKELEYGKSRSAKFYIR
jgi:hypothetical protein